MSELLVTVKSLSNSRKKDNRTSVTIDENGNTAECAGWETFIFDHELPLDPRRHIRQQVQDVQAQVTQWESIQTCELTSTYHLNEKAKVIPKGKAKHMLSL